MTQSAIRQNSAEIAYRCASIYKDNISIVNSPGMNAHMTANKMAINGFLSLTIYPMLILSIRNDTSAVINLTAGLI